MPSIVKGWKIGAANAANLNCSLIVPTYKRPREICTLLEALWKLENEWPREVVIVDGSPDDNVESRVRAYMAGRVVPFVLSYVRSEPGLTRQRNVGVDASTGPYVFFLDDDATPCPGFFRHICDVFADDTEGRIGGVAGFVVNDALPMSWKWRLRYALRLAPPIEPMHYHPSGASVPSSLLSPFHGLRNVDLLPGCCFALRREVFAQDRFSAFFQGYSQGEDMEMSLRVRRNWELVCCGDAHAIHSPATGGRPPAFAKGRMEIRNRFFIWLRYNAHPAFAHRLRFWLDITYCVLFDAASFLRYPRKPQPLSHALGLMCGALECLFHPPRYREPVASKQYDIEWKILAGTP